MSVLIDSGISSADGSNPTLSARVVPERTTQAVVDYYSALVANMNAILAQDPSSVNQSSVSQLLSSMDALRDLATNGLLSPDASNPGGPNIINYVTSAMAKQIDMLSRSLRAVGIVNDSATVSQVLSWKDLATQGLNTIMESAQNAATNNSSFQAMVELEYVTQGNNLLQTQLVQLQSALQAARDATNLLGQLQTIHNYISAPTVDSDPILQFTNTTLFVQKNKETLYSFLTQAQRDLLGLSSAADITPANAKPTVLPTEGAANYNALGVYGMIYYNILFTAPTDPAHLTYEQVAQGGLSLQPDFNLLSERQRIYNLMTPAQRAYWGVVNAADPAISSTTFDQPDLVNAIAAYQPPTGATRWNILWNTFSVTGFIPPASADDVIKSKGLAAYLGQPTTTSLALQTSDVNTSASNLNTVSQNLYGSALSPQVDFQGQNPQDVLNRLLSIRRQLAVILTKLDQLNPPPASGRDPASLGYAISQVLTDLQATVGSDPSAGNLAQQAAALNGLNLWILDNAQNLGTSGDATLAKNAGNYQSNLSTAVTAATNFNSTQQENFRTFMFVFDEFYKSASSILTTLTQIISKMAQNISR